MTGSRLTTTASLRAIIERAFIDYPDHQFMTFDDLDREIRAKSLPDDTRLHMPGCTVNLVLGATTISMMARFHKDDDPFETHGNIVLNTAIQNGQIVVLAKALLLPQQLLPQSAEVSICRAIERAETGVESKIRLGKIIDIDRRLSAIPVSTITRKHNTVTIGLYTNTQSWDEWSKSFKDRTQS
jgi:hypothetical protein